MERAARTANELRSFSSILLICAVAGIFLRVAMMNWEMTTADLIWIIATLLTAGWSASVLRGLGAIIESLQAKREQ